MKALKTVAMMAVKLEWQKVERWVALTAESMAASMGMSLADN